MELSFSGILEIRPEPFRVRKLWTIVQSGRISMMMRKGHWELFKHKLWGDKFWSEGHFYRGVGMVTKETMTHYIEECQEKHWNKTKEQKSLIEY